MLYEIAHLLKEKQIFFWDAVEKKKSFIFFVLHIKKLSGRMLDSTILHAYKMRVINLNFVV